MQRLLEAAVRSLGLERLGERLVPLGAGLVVLLLTFWVASLVRRSLRRALGRISTTGHVDAMLSRAAGYAILLAGGLTALSVTGVPVSAFVAGLGLIGAALGLALKDIVANTVAGLVLLLQRPYSVGDTICVSGVEGVVRDLRVRDTLIEAEDGRLVFLPNQTVFAAVITNSSVNPKRRVEVRVEVPLVSDLESVVAEVARALETVAGRLTEPPACARILSATAATVVIVGHVWVDLAAVSEGEARHRAMLEVMRALFASGALPGQVETAEESIPSASVTPSVDEGLD